MSEIVSFPTLTTETLRSRVEKIFDPDVYNLDENSHLMKLLGVCLSDQGLGGYLKKQFITEKINSINGMWTQQLDGFFGVRFGIPRLNSEFYDIPIDYETKLTKEQWDEIISKDVSYKNRVANIFVAFSNNGTVKGFEELSKAITGQYCEVYECWNWRDEDYIVSNTGRDYTTDSEIIISVDSQNISQRELMTLKNICERLRKAGTLITVNTEGIPSHFDVFPTSSVADSEYFEVKRKATITEQGDPFSSELKEYFALPMPYHEETEKGSEFVKNHNLTGFIPDYALAKTQELEMEYTEGSGSISSAQYYRQIGDSLVEMNPEKVTKIGETYSEWRPFSLADIPQNYPGGKFGIHPTYSPALQEDGRDYVFDAFGSQEDYAKSEFTKLQKVGSFEVYPDYSQYREILTPEKSVYNDEQNAKNSLAKQRVKIPRKSFLPMPERASEIDTYAPGDIF